MTAPTAAQPELLPLPEPLLEFACTVGGKRIDYTADQMQAYACTAVSAALQAPVDMLLFCPRSGCGKQHIDLPETEEQYSERLFESPWWELGGDKPERWDNPPHRSHKCHACGCIWRPADVPTNGVASLKTRGKADTWDWTSALQAQAGEVEGLRAKVATAYGWLWHVNNEPAAPVPLLSSEQAAYEARKILRDTMTHDQRGKAINSVAAILAARTKGTP